MRKAVIDLGTNTFNLIVFEAQGQKFKIIHSERDAVGLGFGGINQQNIDKSAQDRAIKALANFQNKAKQLHAKNIKAFGTSALRDANNKIEFLERIKNETGLKVEVIDGNREAELIFKGVNAVHSFKERTCVMDIGGGSTEFIFVNEKGEVEFAESCNIGVARIIQLFDLNDPLTKSDIADVVQFIEKNSSSKLRSMKAISLVGASGSFDTFLELTGESIDSKYASKEFDHNQLLHILEKLKNSTFEERNQQEKIIEIRKKMIHIAAVMTLWAINIFNCSKTFVSPASLKEGVMWEKS